MRHKTPAARCQRDIQPTRAPRFGDEDTSPETAIVDAIAASTTPANPTASAESRNPFRPPPSPWPEANHASPQPIAATCADSAPACAVPVPSGCPAQFHPDEIVYVCQHPMRMVHAEPRHPISAAAERKSASRAGSEHAPPAPTQVVLLSIASDHVGPIAGGSVTCTRFCTKKM